MMSTIGRPKLKKDEIVGDLFKETGIDPRVIRLAVDSPLKFFREIAANDDDIRPCRIPYFAAFVPKSNYIKSIEDRNNSETLN